MYRLSDANVWWDEGWSIWLSQKDLTWIAWRTAADEHPPLHYWMLHFWNMLAGTEAFAGRFLSVAFGVLTVALLYRIGKKIGGAWMGVRRRGSGPTTANDGTVQTPVVYLEHSLCGIIA